VTGINAAMTRNYRARITEAARLLTEAAQYHRAPNIDYVQHALQELKDAAANKPVPKTRVKYQFRLKWKE